DHRSGHEWPRFDVLSVRLRKAGCRERLYQPELVLREPHSLADLFGWLPTQIVALQRIALFRPNAGQNLLHNLNFLREPYLLLRTWWCHGREDVFIRPVLPAMLHAVFGFAGNQPIRNGSDKI